MTTASLAAPGHTPQDAVWPSVTGRLLAAVAVMFATLAQTFGYLTASVPRWSSFAVACRESVVLPSLLIAASATVWAWALRPDNVVIGRLPARGIVRMVGHVMRVTAVVAVLGYLAGLMPLCIRTAARATFGFIDLLTLCAAVAGLVMVGAVSVWFGVIMPKRRVTLVAVGVVLAAAWLPLALNYTVLANRSSILAPALVWFNEFPEPGWLVTWQANVLRIALYLIVASVAYEAARAHVAGRRIRNVPGIWCGSAIAAIAVIAVVIHPVTLVEPDQANARCTTDVDGTITVCLHPADESIRRRTFELSGRFVELTGWDEPIRLVESPVAAANDTGAVIVGAPSGRADAESVDESVREGLLARFAGYDACPRYDGPVGDDAPTAVIRLVRDELSTRSGGEATPFGIDETTGDVVPDPRRSRLAALDDERFADWYMRNRQAILSCTVTPEALP